MTENELQLQGLNNQIDQAKRDLDLAKALANLEGNADFKKIVSEGYLREEAVRLVMLKGDPQVSLPHQQAAILRDIDAIGSLSEYFRIIRKLGEKAERSIKDAESEIEEIEEEDRAEQEAK